MTRSAANRRNRAARKIAKNFPADVAANCWPWSDKSVRERVGGSDFEVNWPLAAELLNRKGTYRDCDDRYRVVPLRPNARLAAGEAVVLW